MQTLLQDVRYALRQLRKSPAFTIIAVLTLALGIGANTAVFSVMDALLLRALPVSRPHDLYTVEIGGGQEQPPGANNTGNGASSFSDPVFEALRVNHQVFDDLIAFVPLSFSRVPVRYGDVPEETEGDEVSGNFFSGLSAGIVRGRALTLDDEARHAPVLVLSYSYWTRRFARNPSVLGHVLFVKGVPFTIVGVAAEGFQGIEPGGSTDFWVPLQTRPDLNAWSVPSEYNTVYGTPKWWCLRLMARLRSGVTPAAAQAALAPAFGQAAKAGIGAIDPKQWKPLLDFKPALGIAGYSAQYRDPMRILMGLVLLVLLIATTNVALMLIARNAARQQEWSVRLALGASRGRLLRQLLAESALLVCTGAGLGWAFALLATRQLAAWSEIESGLNPNRSVLLFTLAISVLTGLVFGLAPLGSALRAPVAGALRAGGRQLTGTRRRVLGGRILMAAQVAVCMVLLVAAGLLLRTLRNYQTQDLGMHAEQVLVFGVTPQGAKNPADGMLFYGRLLDRLRVLPGVESATLSENRPGSGWSDNSGLTIDGVAQRGQSLRTNTVAPDFFHVFGIPVLQGRVFADSDTAKTPYVTVVNETFAKKFFPHGSALGHLVGDGVRLTIIGVVKDSKYASVDENPVPMAWYDYAQAPAVGAMQVELRTAADPHALLPAAARAVREIDPNLPLEQPMTEAAQFEKSYAQSTMFAALGGFFGVLSAVLVAIGLYGTLAYRTARRTTEIGVRIALGARRGQVLWLVLRESLLVALLGAAAGLPLALASTRSLASMLYQLSPLDPWSAAAALMLVGLIVAIASFVPARRAVSIEPVQALRSE